MSKVVVITFKDDQEAGRMRQTLRELEKRGELVLQDVVVLVKDKKGKIRVKNPTGGTKKGAVTGGVLGLLVFALFPASGIVVGAGAAAGALAGAHLERKIGRRLFSYLNDELQVGHSALFVSASDGDVAAVMAALRPHAGSIFTSNLSPKLEQKLRDALNKKTE